MQYTIKTKSVGDSVAVATSTEFKSLDKAIAKVFELIDYVAEDVSELLICNGDKSVYSIKPLGKGQFVVKELF